MDRQTRRANFKNLQQTSNKLRSTRSTTPLSLTDFFCTPEETAKIAPAAPAPSVETELPSPKIKPIRASNVFEKPGPKPKKAPKLKGSSSSSTATSRRGRGRSKQQPTISNFLRNEQLFSEVTAQHCLADNFSPDDIEMALALSKSEAEKRGCLRLNDENEEEAVVELMDDTVESSENIRRKLQKYGFRTAAKEDYKSLAVLPVVAGKGTRRGKWANKFTALTLRNPKVQQKKLEEKVSTMMAQQVRTKELLEKDRLMPPYELISSNLHALRASRNSQIIHEPSEGALENLGLYYVTDLIEVSQTPADHLLKNWAAIQGRDLSPERETSKSRQLKQQLEIVYAELEKHFGDTQEMDQQVVDELDELEKLVADNMIEDDSKTVEKDASSTKSSPSKEPPDKRPKMANDEKENKQPLSVTILSVPTQLTRCTSPDLFGDSDEEMDIPTISISNEPAELRDFSLKVYKNKSPVKEVEIISSSEEPTQITTYEVFSSDEEDKTDLNNDSQKLLEPNSSRLSQKIFNMSAVFESDSDIDNFNITSALDSCSQAESCPIPRELFLKYAVQDKPTAEKEQENLNEISFGMDRDSETFENSFHLDIETPPSQNKGSSIFSELNFSRKSLQRSVSLSTDNSFKSPFNWKIESSAEKREPIPTPSPCRHSDVSVDLTQNSDDDNDVILLSDEEINYSIWKANKSTKAAPNFEDESSDNSSLSSPVAKKRAVPHFQTEEDLDAFLMAGSSRSPNKSMLSKERAEFGILDAAPSQPFSFSQLQSLVCRHDSPSGIDINWAEASFLDAPVKPLACKSSHKFDDLLAIKPNPKEHNSDNDLDEFDQLVFKTKKDSTMASSETEAMPSGLDLLLNAEIKMPAVEPAEVSVPKNVPDQLEVAGNVYTISVCNEPKPDFASLPESEILQLLYNYGIKPLKRKQAVKMLEFIYNQTHPIMQTLSPQPEPIVRSKSTPVLSAKPRSQLVKSIHTEDCLTPTEPKKDFKFKDASGDELLRFSQSLPPSLCDDFEFYILQTNVSKKTPQPLVPLHIAWHNLLCANPRLHESVLMYEPIDLQEVYLYLKHMGHRYDPKELRGFMDRRCIIFRYELAAPAKQTARHVRKMPKKPTKRT
ncbi:structure-specific endonuclease subunit SLX4 [Drosophila serrata]|uniref:structure-specific endonuclease subunit SLX4 n=1 Tax=Drosophila serrata TaxID=7274 RepID=UPI000A1CFBCB|nr:structure-specific endonuclease subunit SLX4 [Drosophila serrata]